jgi:non-heme chloroperoxidase
VPIGASAHALVQAVKAPPEGLPGLPHGMCSTHKDLVNAALLAFFKGG